jgi:hypothetical protein
MATEGEGDMQEADNICPDCGDDFAPNLSLDTRMYLALADLSEAQDERGEVTTRDLVRVIDAWCCETPYSTTTEAAIMGSLIMSHLSTQDSARHQLAMAQSLAQKLEEANIDTNKIVQQDKTEWVRLVEVARLASTPDSAIPDGELTVTDILSTTNAPLEEGTASERVRQLTVSRVDSQAHIGKAMSQFLRAHAYGDMDTVHSILDHYDCAVVHAVTSTLLQWVAARELLPPEISMDRWFDHILHVAIQTEGLSEDEKFDMGQRLMGDAGD